MSGLIQLYDTLMVFLKEFFKKVDFEKHSADDIVSYESIKLILNFYRQAIKYQSEGNQVNS